MGLLALLSQRLAGLTALPLWQLSLGLFTAFVVSAILLNVLSQLLLRKSNEPPLVFHWVPLIGSTISYGIDPFKFFFACREKYGDVFTFVLLGKKTTVCLGPKGNEFILNSKLREANAEEVYTSLTTPVFGRDVVYDCPNAKLMEQKKFVKFGLTTEAFRSYVTLIQNEVEQFVAKNAAWKDQAGTVNICPTMAELTIYTASRSLQGKEVRERFDSTFADLYHDLDMGFAPINFMLPWAPLPHNKKRDHAQKKMAETYMEIIKARKAEGATEKKEDDMIWNLMSCVYKDGTPVPDMEVAHMMIALLMAGQHSSSSTSAWFMLRLATRPDIQEELLGEQKRTLGEPLPPLTFEDLQRLPLHTNVIKETLRLHAPIHSMMRKVKSPMTITTTLPDDTSRTYTVPTTHTLLSAPGVTSRQPEYFPEPMLWEPHRWDDGHPLAFTGEVREEMTDYGYGMVSKGASSPYLPFGAGRHRCIGEQFANVQLGTILAILVRLIKVENLPGQKGVVDTDYSSLFSRPIAPAVVRYERRAPKSEKS